MVIALHPNIRSCDVISSKRWLTNLTIVADRDVIEAPSMKPAFVGFFLDEIWLASSPLNFKILTDNHRTKLRSQIIDMDCGSVVKYLSSDLKEPGSILLRA